MLSVALTSTVKVAVPSVRLPTSFGAETETIFGASASVPADAAPAGSTTAAATAARTVVPTSETRIGSP